MDQDFKRKVVKNTFFILCARAWSLAIGIWLTPYILGRLGNDQYGIWILAAVFVSYAGLIDLGVGTSFVKYIAEYHTRGDQESVNGVLTTGITVYVVAAVVIIALAYPSIGVILNFFTIPEGMEDTARFVLRLGIIAFLWGNLIGVYDSVINGLQRMDISNAIAMLLSVCYVVGCVIVLEHGFGIRGLAVSQLIIRGIGTVATVYFAYRLNPRLRFRPKAVKKHFWTLVRYGLNLQVSSIAGLINFQFDKLVVSRYVDLSHVTFYDIGSRIVLTARSFPALLHSALVPAASELDAQSKKEDLYELFSKVSKYVSVVAFPLFTGLVVTGELLIDAWVGFGYDLSVRVLRILCIGYLFNSLAGPVSPLVQGLGHANYQRNAEALSLGLNVVLSVVLILRYGFYGAVVGTTIAMSVAAVYYVWSFHRLMERPVLPFLRCTFVKPALGSAVSGLLGVSVIAAFIRYASASRAAALLICLSSATVFTASYVALIVKCRYLDELNMTAVRKYLSMIRGTPSGTLPTDARQ